MKKLRVWVSTGYVGAGYEDEFEVEDSITEDECEETAREFMESYIEFGWEVTDDA